MAPRERFSTFDDRVETRATKSDMRHLKSVVGGQDSLADTAYKQGLKDGKTQTKQPKPAKSSRTASRARKAGGAVAREVKRPVKQGSTKALRQVQGAASDQIYSGLYILGLCLLVVLLYDLLRNASSVGGFLGGISSALAWLEDPGKSIGYAN